MKGLLEGIEAGGWLGVGAEPGKLGGRGAGGGFAGGEVEFWGM